MIFLFVWSVLRDKKYSGVSEEGDHRRFMDAKEVTTF